MFKEIKNLDEAREYCRGFGLWDSKIDATILFPVSDALQRAYEAGYEAGVERGILKIETGE